MESFFCKIVSADYIFGNATNFRHVALLCNKLNYRFLLDIFFELFRTGKSILQHQNVDEQFFVNLFVEKLF